MAQVIVDSADTTAIQYDSYGPSPWQFTGVDDTSDGDVFDQTLTEVESEGGAVFRFHGTNVQVYGSLPPPAGAVNSSYTIDGSQKGLFSSIPDPPALPAEGDRQLFFDSGTLSDDSHVLVINVTLASAAEPYLLDYIQYTISNATSSTTTSSASATASPAASHSSHSRIGAIVGGVVGGVLLISPLALFLFFRDFRHRISLSGRQRGGRDLIEGLAGPGKPDSHITPFPTDPSMSEPLRSSTQNYGNLPALPFAVSSTPRPEDSALQVAGPIYAAESTQQVQGGPSGGAGPSMLADSGPSLGATSDTKHLIPPSAQEALSDMDEAPPAYTPPQP
ncbi:hypothetical protein BD414DRAFT_472850 [Trametes punicea]|nr:hypothetical protein BD414DRAFT_472850 [Trametes punicea]